jgi:phage protein U
VTNVGAESSYLDAKGVGQVIEFDISLRRGDAPQDADFFATMIGMLE